MCNRRCSYLVESWDCDSPFDDIQPPRNL
jgi:hypothetical protein